MTEKEVMKNLQDIFRDQFDNGEIILTDETTAADIEGWDSLAHMELIFRVESFFSIRFAMGEINSFANVGEMCQSICSHLLEGKRP